MDFDFLSPVSEELIERLSGLNEQALGANIKIHTDNSGVPDLEGVQVAIVGVRENRLADYGDENLHFDDITSFLLPAVSGQLAYQYRRFGEY